MLPLSVPYSALLPCQDFSAEFNKKQIELDRLNASASQLPSSKVIQVQVVETLQSLNGQLQTVQRRLELFPSLMVN